MRILFSELLTRSFGRCPIQRRFPVARFCPCTWPYIVPRHVVRAMVSRRLICPNTVVYYLSAVLYRCETAAAMRGDQLGGSFERIELHTLILACECMDKCTLSSALLRKVLVYPLKGTFYSVCVFVNRLCPNLRDT